MLWTKGVHQPQAPAYRNEKQNMKLMNMKIFLFFKRAFQGLCLLTDALKSNFRGLESFSELHFLK